GYGEPTGHRRRPNGQPRLDTLHQAEDLACPVHTLPAPPGVLPERRDRGEQLQCQIWLVGHRPFERRLQVLDLRLDEADPFLLCSSPKVARRLGGEIDEVGGMLRRQIHGATLTSERTNGLEKAVPAAPPQIDRGDEGMVDEPAQALCYEALVQLPAGADRLGGGERERAGEDAQPREQEPVGRLEQPIAPVDGAVEGGMPRVGSRSGENVDAGFELVQQVDEIEGPGPRRRQLEGERDPVETPHHIPDGRQLVVRVEAGRGGCRSVGEQSDRRVSADVAVCRGQWEWVDRKDDLAAHSERNTTRGENRHVFGRGDDPLSHGRDGLLHVLTVVENEQALLLAQGFDEGSGRVSAW